MGSSWDVESGYMVRCEKGKGVPTHIVRKVRRYEYHRIEERISGSGGDNCWLSWPGLACPVSLLISSTCWERGKQICLVEEKVE